MTMAILWTIMLAFAYLFGFYFRMCWLMWEESLLEREFRPEVAIDLIRRSAGWPSWAYEFVRRIFRSIR